METRKTIGTLLLALAAVVCLASNVWFIIKMPSGGDKTEQLLLHSLPEVLILVMMAYNFAHPGLRRSKPTIDIVHRRIKRKTNWSIDPDGYRYETQGLSAVHPFHHVHRTVDNGNMLSLGLIWQMDFGRRFNKGEKTLQNGGYDNGMVR